MRLIQPLKLPIKQTGSGVRIRATVPRPAPVLHPTQKVIAPSGYGTATQTDLVIVNREHPIVNFLENSEAVLQPLSIPNCYYFASSRQYAKSQKILIIIDG